MSVPSGASLDKITALSKRRGFVYATSDIYGGLASSYDYGPLGAELLRNIRNLWWHDMITTREDMIGLNTQILLQPAAPGYPQDVHFPPVSRVTSAGFGEEGVGRGCFRLVHGGGVSRWGEPWVLLPEAD